MTLIKYYNDELKWDNIADI